MTRLSRPEQSAQMSQHFKYTSCKGSVHSTDIFVASNGTYAGSSNRTTPSQASLYIISDRAAIVKED